MRKMNSTPAFTANGLMLPVASAYASSPTNPACLCARGLNAQAPRIPTQDHKLQPLHPPPTFLNYIALKLSNPQPSTSQPRTPQRGTHHTQPHPMKDKSLETLLNCSCPPHSAAARCCSCPTWQPAEGGRWPPPRLQRSSRRGGSVHPMAAPRAGGWSSKKGCRSGHLKRS